jgi:hypothetical protein
MTTLIIFLQRLAGFGVIAIVIARAAMLVPIPPITDSLSGSVVARTAGDAVRVDAATGTSLPFRCGPVRHRPGMLDSTYSVSWSPSNHG